MIKLPFQPNMIIPVGDMHVHKDDIVEATRFIKWLVDGVKQLNKSMSTQAVLFFMGDQYNDFGTKNVVVETFWKWAYSYINSELGYPSASLIGNHDMNQQETENGMDVHDESTVVIGRTPIMFAEGIGAVGFIRNEELFYAAVMNLYALGARKIFCHADFDGAQFESGYYSPLGFDLSRYPADLKFYSGHVHLKQEFGNVFYFGTARHLTKSDINEKKGIHIMDLATGKMTFQDTPFEVWSPFTELKIEEGDPNLKALMEQADNLAKTLHSPSKLYVEIRGTKEFCKKTERQLPGGIKTNSSYTDCGTLVTVKESEGIPATFSKFSAAFFSTAATPQDIQTEVLTRIYQACPTLKNGVV